MHKSALATVIWLAVAVVTAQGSVQAQDSSSWPATTQTPAQKSPQKPGEVKIQKEISPAKTRVAPVPLSGDQLSRFSTQKPITEGTGGLSGTNVPKSNPGNDPAFDAFEQGRYLSAHNLAVEADKRDEPQAATLLGRLYQEGLGVKQDQVLAAQWFRRAAELGDTEGTFAFAVMLAEGDGIQKNRSGAAQLFETAALKGHALANYNLALLYLRGDGKPENPDRAAQHLRYAAEQGIAQAQYDLATLYATGAGQTIQANATESATWMEKAADQGLAEAELEFGVSLFLGRGVEPSKTKGMLYFKSAAEKGVAAAQNRLARCYALGLGTDINLLEAAKWHTIAQRQGITDDGLDRALVKLSRADRTTASRLADEWLDSQAMQ
jgi:uncharacterized protein